MLLQKSAVEILSRNFIFATRFYRLPTTTPPVFAIHSLFLAVVRRPSSIFIVACMHFDRKAGLLRQLRRLLALGSLIVASFRRVCLPVSPFSSRADALEVWLPPTCDAR